MIWTDPDDEVIEEEWSAAEAHAIFLPPWRIRNADGSWCLYGPDSLTSWERTLDDWAESVGGGGLWDPQAAATALAVKRIEARRTDGEAALNFLRACGERVPAREKAAAVAFYSGRSKAAIARDLRIAVTTVNTMISRFRARMSGARMQQK